MVLVMWVRLVVRKETQQFKKLFMYDGILPENREQEGERVKEKEKALL